MKKHKFSEKLPEAGKEIFASIDGQLGAFVSIRDMAGKFLLEALGWFVSGWDFSTDWVRLENMDLDDWWADPEEE